MRSFNDDENFGNRMFYLASRYSKKDDRILVLRIAAESGNTHSMLSLGIELEGDNDREAYAWYKAALEHGIVVARFYIARLMVEGKFVEKDTEKAKSMFVEYIESISNTSCDYVSRIYEDLSMDRFVGCDYNTVLPKDYVWLLVLSCHLSLFLSLISPLPLSFPFYLSLSL